MFIMININNLIKKFGKKIKIERIKRDWSQEKLSEVADLHPSTISSIETSKYLPGIDTAAKLANAFGLTMDQLMDFNF